MATTNATTLQCVQALALYMQHEFMRGIPYGQVGTPNMQSLIELSTMDAETASSMIQAEPRIAPYLERVTHGD